MSHNILLPYGKYLWLINTYSYPRNNTNQDIFPFIVYTRDDLCRNIRDYFRSFGEGCRIIRRAEFLEKVR
jgi:hypothetical protein